VKDPIAAALLLSVDWISRNNAFAADCLFLAACVDRKDISLDIIETASMNVREDAIKMLDKYALVTRRPSACLAPNDRGGFFAFSDMRHEQRVPAHQSHKLRASEPQPHISAVTRTLPAQPQLSVPQHKSIAKTSLLT
jgi:hypothetical protein